MKRTVTVFIALALVLSFSVVSTAPVAASNGPPVASGLVLHLDADTITGLSDGDPVATWTDLSGEDNHATQGTIANQPEWVESALAGKPVVRFDGSSTFLLVSPILDPSQDNWSLFTVVTPAATTSQDIWQQLDGTTGPGRVNVSIRTVATTTQYSSFLGGAQRPSGIGVVGTQANLLTQTWDGTTLAWWGDGTTGNTHTLTAEPANGGYHIGVNKGMTGNWLHGDIAEILIYDRTLTTQERVDMEWYLGEKWLGWERPAEVWVCDADGDDGNPGTFGDPFKTIQHGVTVVAAGGTVHVCPGTYSEDVTITDKSLTLRSTGGAGVTTITGRVTITLSGTKTVVFGGEEEHGFTIDRGNPVPDSGILLSVGNGADVTISHNTITGEDVGIRSEAGGIQGGSTVTIEHNVITGCPGHGVHLQDVSDGIVDILNNQITANGANGIYVYRIDDGPETVTIAGNHIADNTGHGIRVDEVSKSALVIEDKDIVDNGVADVYIHEINDSTVTIGGDTEAKGNTISRNGTTDPFTGIHIGSVTDDGDVTIEYNSITDNNGAGVFIGHIGLTPLTVTIARNIIAGNTGGGIHADTVDESSLVIDHNHIQGNGGAGIYVWRVRQGSIVDIASNTIGGDEEDEGNGGAGIYIGNIADSTVTIGGDTDRDGNIISRNGKGELATGIRISDVDDSDVTIEHNTITHNEGAGVFIGHTRFALDTITIARNTIAGNTGGGIHANTIYDSTLVIVENTITDNEGAGIRFETIMRSPETVEILNNTIRGNDIGIDVISFSWSTLIILGNEISENRVGIQIAGEIAPPNNAVISKVEGPTDGTISIAFNNILSNTEWGLHNGREDEVEATHNWWGHASGPSGEGDGSGDAVSEDVDFTPWLGAAIDPQAVGCTADRGYGVDAGAETDNVSADATGGGETTTVTVAEYVGNPTDVAPGFAAGAFFFDVHVGGSDPDPDQLVVEVDCPGGNCAGVVLKWFNEDADEWQVVDPQQVVNGKIRAELNNVDSSPLVSELTGTPFALGNPLTPVGGTGHLVNRLALLLPWLVLGAAIIAGAAIFMSRRQTQS